MGSNGWTPIQRAILDVLEDGLPHRRQDLLDVIDEQATPHNLRNHLARMRKRLGPLGQDVVCVYRHRQIHYQWVRLIRPSNLD